MKRAAAELDAILARKFAHEVFQGVRDRIFETKCRPLEPYESYSQRLSEGEQIVILAAVFIWEVSNGGLSQFLGNSSGDHAEATLAAMRRVGAAEAADALAEVGVVIFAGTPIPADRRARCDILFSWEDQDGERSRAFYAKHELGWCESVEVAVARFILANKEQFS